MAKWARAEKEKYVYNALIKKGVSVKEAQAARSLGQKTIKERYGVELKKLEEKKVDYTLRVDPQRKGVYIKRDYVKPVRKTQKKPDAIDKAFAQQRKLMSPQQQLQTRRARLWKTYSEKFEQNMPQRHILIAQKANLEQGFDINDKYGFAIAYYAFIYNKSVEEVKANTNVGMFMPEEYVVNTSRLVS